jgi:methionyl-tRNA formyltransferase
MNTLRIVFMGTPQFAATILKHLVVTNFKVVGVVTAADKPAGRGLKLTESEVKKYAHSEKITILQPTNLKNEDFLATLKNLQADLFIIVAFRMLPKEVWSMPKLGTFNLHASLLPDYRGAAPIHWAIINGETKTGVTTFFIDDKIDTGEIILQQEIEISDDETVGTLHDKLMNLGANLVAKTVDYIENQLVKTIKQPNIEKNAAPKLTPENTKIDWTETLDNVYNKIRGLNPFPAAWTNIQINGEEISAKIYAVKKEKITHSLNYGTIISNKTSLKVAVKNGFIHILEMKISGKRQMDTKSLLNGFTFSDDAKML